MCKLTKPKESDEKYLCSIRISLQRSQSNPKQARAGADSAPSWFFLNNFLNSWWPAGHRKIFRNTGKILFVASQSAFLVSISGQHSSQRLLRHQARSLSSFSSRRIKTSLFKRARGAVGGEATDVSEKFSLSELLYFHEEQNKCYF